MDNDYTKPATLQDELTSLDYRIQPGREPGADPVEYFWELIELVQKRTDTAIHLLEEYDMELFWTVFMSTDLAQHYLWDDSIDGEPAVDKLYVAVDEAIDRLLTATEEEWNVILMSDHGAGRINYELHLNSLLKQWQYLTGDTEDTGPIKTLKQLSLDTVVETSRRIPVQYKQRVIDALPDTVVNKLTEATGTTGKHIGKAMTWDETRILSFGYMRRLFIHTTEQYPEGTVPKSEYEEIRDGIISRLEGLKRPESGEPLIERAVRTDGFMTVNTWIKLRTSS